MSDDVSSSFPVTWLLTFATAIYVLYKFTIFFYIKLFYTN